MGKILTLHFDQANKLTFLPAKAFMLDDQSPRFPMHPAFFYVKCSHRREINEKMAHTSPTTRQGSTVRVSTCKNMPISQREVLAISSTKIRFKVIQLDEHSSFYITSFYKIVSEKKQVP